MDANLCRATPALSIRQLEAQLTELAGHCNAAEYRWLTLLAEFDRRHGWSDGGTHSCAHWLNWKCGIDLGAAREKVRVAHALQKLPKIAASMARGELSYSKVRAVTRVACAATEEIFLNMALHGTAHHVERLVRTPAIRRALNARDRGCRFPGCTHQRYVDAHHIRHWAQGGETKAANLLTLCRFHHRAVHEGQIRVEALDDGALRFVRPDGYLFQSAMPGSAVALGDWTQLAAAHREEGIHITPQTATTRWRGETMDYGTAIDSMLYRLRRAAGVSAETRDLKTGDDG